MKKIALIFITLFSLLIIGGVKYECYEKNDKFQDIEVDILKEYEFIQNGVKLEYITEASIEEEKKRIISLLISRFNVSIESKDNNIVGKNDFFSVDINFVRDGETKVEIIIINNVEDFTTLKLRQAMENFKNYKCKEERYYYFVKVKVDEFFYLNGSSILSRVKKDTIEKLEISNGLVIKANLSDDTKLNIGEINYDTGKYLIVGTPVIFVTY